MKKELLLSILGMTALSSFGQGFINLDNYNYPGGIITYGAGFPLNGVSGALGILGTGLNSSWTMGIYWALGTPAITDPAGINTPIAPLAEGTGPGSTAAYAGAGPGIFLATSYFAVPGSTVGSTATFEVVAFPTVDGSYSAVPPTGFRVHSSPFTLTLMAGNALPPTANVGPAFTTFGWYPIPEPTTLALAGLGASLLVAWVRRKNF